MSMGMRELSGEKVNYEGGIGRFELLKGAVAWRWHSPSGKPKFSFHLCGLASLREALALSRNTMSILESITRTEDYDAVIDITPSLPAGRAVGIRHFCAMDPGREDGSTGKRRFMVSAFYPGVLDRDAPRARLVDLLYPRVDDALELLARESGLGETDKGFAFEHLKTLALRAQRGLALQGSAARPVLIHYPGGQSHRMSNAAVCEALASRGFVVLALDAPRDAPAVVFPDGCMVTPPAPDDENHIWPRIADVRFLLDQLEEMSAAFFDGCLDPGRVGMFGHSRGGYLSNICAVEDSRIRAAANMDGFLWGIWTQHGTGLNEFSPEFVQRARSLATPILRLKSDPGSEEKAQLRFEEESCDFGGDFILVALHGWEHRDFATTPWLSGAAADFAGNVRHPVAPAARVELLTGLLADFFGTYLMGLRTQMAMLDEGDVGMDVFFRCDMPAGP